MPAGAAAPKLRLVHSWVGLQIQLPTPSPSLPCTPDPFALHSSLPAPACSQDITGWTEGERELVTKWRFSAILDLPWRPRLAAAGGTTHVFDEVRPPASLPLRAAAVLAAYKLATARWWEW